MLCLTQHHPLRQTVAGSDVHRPAQPVRGLQDYLCHSEDPVHEGEHRRGGRRTGNGGSEARCDEGEMEWVRSIQCSVSLKKHWINNSFKIFYKGYCRYEKNRDSNQ